jgi:SAM-dependent MidA family methyltransferase
VARSGRPWRYDEVVGAALYDHEHGFYGSGQGRAGRRADFLTSPEVGPLFGAVVGRALDGWWAELDRPDPYVVVEAGAGPGTLARAVRAAQPACLPALRYVAVEVSAAQRASHPSEVDSRASLPSGRAAHVVLAHELLDNLPFRLLQRDAGAWREVMVTGAGEELGGAVDADRLASLRPAGLPDGARVPLQDAARDWVAAAVALSVGRVVVLDYASTTADLAERPWTDWVRTYRGHERGGHPLDAPGTQDVTCEVAVDQLPAPRRSERQDEALRRWGLDDLVEEGRRRWTERAGVGDLAALVARSRVREAEALTDPGGLGGFAVFEWAGVADPPSATGVAPASR